MRTYSHAPLLTCARAHSLNTPPSSGAPPTWESGRLATYHVMYGCRPARLRPACTHLSIFSLYHLFPQARRARRGAARARAGLGLRAVRRRREAAAGVIWSQVLKSTHTPHRSPLSCLPCSASIAASSSQTTQLGKVKYYLRRPGRGAVEDVKSAAQLRVRP
jgi:hypothetical protein